MRLKNRVAFVTGAAGWLGRHFSRALLREGAGVCLTDLSPEEVEEAAADPGPQKSIVKAVVDVCDRRRIEEGVQKVVDSFGRLDILVNVAGGSLHTPSPFGEIEEYGWDRVLDVNLKGTFMQGLGRGPAQGDRGVQSDQRHQGKHT